MYIDQLEKKLNRIEEIILFRNIKNNSLVNNFKKIYNNKNSDIRSINDLLYQLIEFTESKGLQGDIWHNYLKNLVIKAENIFSLTAEKTQLAQDSSLYQMALKDLKIINNLFEITIRDILLSLNLNEMDYLIDFKAVNINHQNTKLYQEILTNNNAAENLKELNDFYQHYGVNILNQSRAFFWQNKNLKTISNPDQISFKQIISYKKQKKRLIENTQSFLNDKKAHNVLLYGDSGTGKSSSVKALLNEFFEQGLRLVEINSSQIKELPDILEFLSRRGLYFIIFMDDLSFEEFETDYKYLKAVMEGGIESKPENVLFYATSNRRHLVREKWQDRESEIHENDILNEKLSLSERFGLTLMYNSPAQEEYLKIVRELAKQEDILLDQESLEARALEWSRWNNGRSGRTARQFIDQLLKEEF